MDAVQFLRTWIKASRLASQLYICIPLLVGQLYAHTAGHELNGWIFFWVQGFGLCIQLFIVYANDYADVEADRINQTYTPFSGGSRVLVDGELKPETLKRTAIYLAGLSLCIGLLLGVLWARWLAVALAVLSILLLQLYSYHPIRLNYRGGGEVLQMAGTGVLLPVFGWYAQAGTLTGFPVSCFAVLLPTMLACAIGTSLPDERSDRAVRKRSATVLLGQRFAQQLVILLHSLSAGLLFALCRTPDSGAASLLGVAAGLAITAQLVLLGGQPGSRRLLAFGMASIATTLLLTLATAIFPPVPRHNFLVLCLLLAVPALGAYGRRPDLRKGMRITALAALPFAFTETFFLGAYWSPEFLFDLGWKFGFGLEDFLFVSALGMVSFASYPVVFKRRLTPIAHQPQKLISLLPLFAASLAMGFILLSAVPVILGAGGVMGLFIATVWLVRRDLMRPSCGGGLVTGLTYAVICLAWQLLFPGLFTRVWNQDALSGLSVAGVPVEELAYATLAGMAGSLLYPLLAHKRFTKPPQDTHLNVLPGPADDIDLPLGIAVDEGV